MSWRAGGAFPITMGCERILLVVTSYSENLIVCCFTVKQLQAEESSNS